MRTSGLSALTSTSEQARSSRGGATCPSSTPSTSSGSLLGYTTTYGALVAATPLTGGGAAAGAQRTRREPPELRPLRAPRAMPPRQMAQPRYALDFGPSGGDPMDHMADTARQMTMCATTRDLADGTQRNTWHLPGYTGFQCAAKQNPDAVDQSMGSKSKAKDTVRACPPAQPPPSVAIPNDRTSVSLCAPRMRSWIFHRLVALVP